MVGPLTENVIRIVDRDLAGAVPERHRQDPLTVNHCTHRRSEAQCVAAIDVPNVAVPNAVWAAQERVAFS